MANVPPGTGTISKLMSPPGESRGVLFWGKSQHGRRATRRVVISLKKGMVDGRRMLIPFVKFH